MIDLNYLWSKIRAPILLLIVSLILGALGYRFFFPEEDWTRIFFMTAITLTTVGYGDVLGVENNWAASWYTMFLMLVGMGIVLYAVSAVTAFFVDGKLQEILLDNRIRRRVRHMHDHYIICGAGQTGIHVIREMIETGHKFVVIDGNPEKRDELLAEFPDINILHGDATSDKLLTEARIEEAKGLVAALSSDKDNLFLTITARMMNPNIRIVSRAIEIAIQERLRMAGANYVVSPNFIGGLRIASEILRPHVVTFLDRMLRGKDKSIRIDEVDIPEGSPVHGKTLAQAAIHRKTGVLIIAYSKSRTEENFIYNPGPDLLLESGGVLVFIGNPEKHSALNRMVAG